MKRGAIWLIAVLSIAARLWKIDAPFDDLWSWRQSDVAAIAFNYFKDSFSFCEAAKSPNLSLAWKFARAGRDSHRILPRHKLVVRLLSGIRRLFLRVSTPVSSSADYRIYELKKE
jgi:hypothetical protein